MSAASRAAGFDTAAGEASALGHDFARADLLRLALTHSSWANEHGAGQEHNERLEFLGDAVLELCVSQKLFSSIPGAREGELTRLRSELVSTESLAQRAREQGLDKRLLLGRGEERQGGRERDTVLSDLFEAVLGAIFADGGFAAAASGPSTRPRKRRLSCWARAYDGAGRRFPGGRHSPLLAREGVPSPRTPHPPPARFVLVNEALR